MNETARLQLPLLAAGQAQKELFHNEALQRLDALVAPCVAGTAMAAPPPAPAVGECFLVAAGASGAWAGQAGALAMFGEGGWRFVAPHEGLRVWLATPGVEAIHRGGAWEVGAVRGAKLVVNGVKVVGEQASAIVAPTGGGTVDAEARTAIGQMLAALRAHGLIAS